MKRPTAATMLLVGASSLTVVYAADRAGRWTATPTTQVDDHAHVRAARGDRVDSRLGIAGIVGTAIAASQLPRQNLATNDTPATANQTGKHKWPRIRIADAYFRDTAERMLDAAVSALSHSECQMVTSDFVDDRGQPLSARLTEFGITARGYLGLVVFEDGTGRGACKRDGVLAFTAPGSRVIYLCGRTFVRSAQREPKKLEAIMIHEMLHSLGLGENPPTSEHITYRVRQRCWR